MKLVSAEQMRNMDACAIEQYGIPSIVLMENAGRSAAEIIHQRYHSMVQEALIFSGKGNNGGDGYVIARHLQLRGWEVKVVVLAGIEELHGSAAQNLQVLQQAGIPLEIAPDALALKKILSALPRQDILIVDAMFGNGLTSAIRGHYLDALRWINAAEALVAAVDMPSGVEATSGEVLGEAIEADCSISFACAKVGQVSAPASYIGGELYVADIGMPKVLMDSVSDAMVYVDALVARDLLPERNSGAHKGDCGHSLIIAGAPGKGGAAQMAADACVRSGSGLTTLATLQEVQNSIGGNIPEVMSWPIDMPGGWNTEVVQELTRLWQERDVVALGPGMGQDEKCACMIREVVAECTVPLVIDADGLNGLIPVVEVLKKRAPGTTILTPHPGEMARLCGCSVAEVQAQRLKVASDFAARYGVILVLKGARTVIADPAGKLRINSTGNAGMASGGMGDILTGIITALVAQGMDLFNAATLGVYLHGKAADICSVELGPVGYAATDVATRICTAWQDLSKG